MLFLMLSENKKASCGTIPILFLRSNKFKELISFPSTVISPSVTSYSLEIKDKIVDFPAPVFPKIANVSPFFTVKERFCMAFILVSS
ncbi:hypothetical protein D3C72_2130450 [compost metagenome]